MNNQTQLKILSFAILIFMLISIVVMYYVGGFGEGNTFKINNYRVFESGIESVEDIDWDKSEYKHHQIKVDESFVDYQLFVGVDLNEYSGTEELIYLELNNPSFREIEMYRISENGEPVFFGRGGTGFKESNYYGYPNPVFLVNRNEAGYSSRVVFGIKSFTPVDFLVTASSEKNFLENYNKVLLFVSVYLGIMVALFLYNLILYLSIKDRVYFYYCFYICFICLAQLSLSGHSYHFFLNKNAYLYEISIIGFNSLSSIFVIPFIKVFLKTDFYLPKIGKWLNLIVYVYLLALLFRLLGFVELSYLMLDISGINIAISFFSIGFYVAWKGYRSAYFFLLAWSFFLIGLVIYILHNQGVFNIGSYANLPMLAGTAIEAILLSFALADKINILKKEKENEQREKVDALKENERLIKEQNIYLEKMVHSRTEELEQTLKNLQNTQTQLVNQEKMASLGQLTAGIAHEINNPINFVSSNISPLKRDLKDILEVVGVYRRKGEEEFCVESKKELKNLEEDLELDYLIEEVEQLLHGIEDGAKRTVEIVRGLRLFSRVDEQDVKKVDIHDGLDSTLILLSSSMQGRIKITKEYGELPLVECLAGKLNQVFMNIINNAIHALLDSHKIINNPEITIRTGKQGEYVKIDIQDNGPGMPDHVKEKIFEPFFTTKEVGKGTGLGLSIVYTVIENHDGRLEVNSKLDGGTIFVIILPVNQKSKKNER